MGKFTVLSMEDMPKPSTLNEMIRLSEILVAPFDYVRFDRYNLGGKLYFRERTFHHYGSKRLILPEEWDYKLGEVLNFTDFKDCAN